MSYLFFDTETTGLPDNPNASALDLDNWPRVVQLAWARVSVQSDFVKDAQSYVVKPDGFEIPSDAWKVHGISTASAHRHGNPLSEVLEAFMKAARASDALVAHNVRFDLPVVDAELSRAHIWDIPRLPSICTKRQSTDFCKLPKPSGHYGYKWPTLQELHQKLFGDRFENAHDAEADVRAGARCFLELVNRGIIDPNPESQTGTESRTGFPEGSPPTDRTDTLPF